MNRSVIEYIVICFLFSFFIPLSTFSQIDLHGKYWSGTCGIKHGYFLRLLPNSIAHFTTIYEVEDEYERGVWKQHQDTITLVLDKTKKIEKFIILDSLTLRKLNARPHVLVSKLYRFEGYYPNGDIKYKLGYNFPENEKVELNGRLCYYFSKKRLRQMVDYVDGKKDGMETNFREHGYIQNYGKWHDGLKHGVWRYYDVDFNLVKVCKFKKGELISKEEFQPCYPGWNMEVYEKLYRDK